MFDSLKIEKDFVRFAPQGYASLEEGVTMVSCVLVFCRERHYRCLLVDATKLYGFAPPTVGERYRMALQWARDAGEAVVLAMITRPEFMHPERLIGVVASSEGLRFHGFTVESEAIEWLLTAQSGTGTTR
jgi:hypothetical protein